MEEEERGKGIVEGALSGAVEGEEARLSAREEIAALFELSYLLRDEGVFKVLSDPKFKDYNVALRPILSHLIRTTNMNGFEGEIFKCTAKLALDLVLFSRSERDITLLELALIEALKAHLSSVASDAVGGWRGRLITERTRVYRVETGERHRGLLSKLLGR